VTVTANQATEFDIVLGQWDGGDQRDDLSAIAVTPNVSLATIQTIFDSSCTGCHRANTSNSGGLDLTDGNSLAALINQPSSFVPGLTLVEPGVVSRSYLFEKINRARPQQGTRMRPTDSMTLSNQALIRDWIAQLQPTYERFLLQTYQATPDMANTAPSEDFDQDGTVNLHSYLSAAPLSQALVGTQPQLVFDHPGLTPIDLTMFVQQSMNLTNWTTTAVRPRHQTWQVQAGFSVDISNPDATTIQVPSQMGEHRRFFRMLFGR